MRFSPGDSIGRYEIEALLGEGGMGEVYRARDSRLERSVALKVLRNQTEGDSDEWNHAVMRMQREAKAVAALSHANIVAIYDVGEHDGCPFIAMELVPGKTLRELVGTDLAYGRRLRILLDVARALEAAHDAGVVHRDIKPENILVRDDGTAKVLDFGIARRTSAAVEIATKTIDANEKTVDAGLVTMTAEGALVGTPAYMAPEQLRGEPIDARADQFAWGVVAYELLAGKHPFHAERGAVALLSSILGDTPEPLTEAPEDVAAIVMRTLEKQPEDRWTSMHDTAASWSSFITGDEMTKVPTGRGQTTVVTNSGPERTNPPAVRSPRRMVVGVSVVITALAIGFGVHRSQSSTAPAIAATALSASAPSAPITMTDLPIPASDSLEARAAFREGLQALRDARWQTASAAFDRARTVDPGMAAAHMRHATVVMATYMPVAREAYGKAVGLRASLSERDQGLLHAIEPIILHEPSDYVTAERRFAELSARYPKDTEFVFWRAHVNFKINTPETRTRALELGKQCTTFDPRHADCWQVQSWVLQKENRLDDAVVALDHCIVASTNATDCLQDKIGIDATRGHCSVVVDSVRQLTARDPVAPRPHAMLAEALYFADAPEATVRLATEQAARQYRNQGRPFDAAERSVFVAVALGDFAGAIRETDVMANSLQPPSMVMYLRLFFTRVDLRQELGDLRGASAIADEFFVKNALRPLQPESALFDPTIIMNAVKFEAGTMSKRAYESARSAWLVEHPANTPAERMTRWMAAYGLPAFSKDLAETALTEFKALPGSLPDSPTQFALPMSTALGKVYLLAGKHAEAIPLLESVTRNCLQIEPLLWHAQSMARLGIAREATGDKPGACKAYQWLLARWGHSKESVTAKDVAKRANALGCEAPGK